MRYDFQAIAEANPLLDVVRSRYGIELKRSGKEFVGPCPKCGGKDRFSVQSRRQTWYCRGCQTGGDVTRLIAWVDGVGYGEAARSLGAQSPREEPRQPWGDWR